MSIVVVEVSVGLRGFLGGVAAGGLLQPRADGGATYEEVCLCTRPPQLRRGKRSDAEWHV